ADGEAAQGGPPHPVDGQLLESVLGGVDGEGEERGQGAREQAGHDAAGQAFRSDEGGVRSDREERAHADDVAAGGGAGRAGQGDGDEAARLPLEEQELHGQEHGGHGGGEGGGHPGGGSGHEERAPLGRGQVEELRDHGAEGAAGHDDRTFRAEGAARPDGDGGRERLEEGDPGLDLAALEQDGLDRFRDPVAADTLGPVAGHEADDEGARHGDEDLEPPEVVARGRHHLRRPALEEEQVREQADQLQEGQGHVRGDDADDDGQGREREHAAGGGEVAQAVRALVVAEAGPESEEAGGGGAGFGVDGGGQAGRYRG